MPVGIVPVVGRRTLAKAKVENPVSGRLYSLMQWILPLEGSFFKATGRII